MRPSLLNSGRLRSEVGSGGWTLGPPSSGFRSPPTAKFRSRTTSASTRRRAADLAAATDTTAAQLDRVGRVLQDHATDLADLVARGRALTERARAAGTWCWPSTAAAVTGCSACCVSRRPGCRTSRTGCAVDERIAALTSERTNGATVDA